MALAVLLIYVAVLLCIGLYARSRVQTQADFLVAGGKVGWFVGGGTLAATQMSAGTAVGTVGFTYLLGYSFHWAWLAIWASWILMVAFIAPKIKEFYVREGGLTIPDLLARRYESSAVRLVSAILIIIVFDVLICAELIGASYVLEVFFGVPKAGGVFLVSALFILYTVLGGMMAVVFNDIFNMLVFVAGFWLAAITLIVKSGGFAAMNAKAAAIAPHMVGMGMPPSAMFAIALSFFLMMIGYPIITVRFFALKDRRTIRRAVGLALIFQALIASGAAIVGVGARVMFPELATPDLASPTVAMNVLHPVLGGLLLSAILAAILSTVDSILVMLSGNVSEDIVGRFIRPNLTSRQKIAVARTSIVVLSLIPIYFALRPLPLVQQIWINGAAVLGCSLAVPVFFGLVWKRAGTMGGLLSMIAGFAGAVLWYVLNKPGGIDPVYIGITCSLLAMVVGSLATAPPSDWALGPFFKGVPYEPSIKGD